jgi:putative transposase
MRAPFTQLYVHCVWATWDRLHLLGPQLERPVYAAIVAKCKELKCEALAIGGMPDHVHLLVRLSASLAVADLLHHVKGASSHLVTHQLALDEFFKWQGAYGAFTVAKADVPRVKTYIEAQKEHHVSGEVWQEWEWCVTPEDEREGERD